MFRLLFKKTLILILCLAISFPTCAAISVSDGSVFVTKAEFSADLNNLSNRMAQLENNLDSTIDSLVSSYLSRNGIWNSKKQKVEKENMLDLWIEKTETGFPKDFAARIALGTITEGVEAVIRDKSWDFIKECDKSGLLVGSFRIYNGYDFVKMYKPSATGTDARHFAYVPSKVDPSDWYKTQARNNSICSDGTYLGFSTSGTLRYTVRPTNLSCHREAGLADSYAGEDAQPYRSSIHYVPQTGTYNALFFVNKGDKVVLKYHMGLSPQTNDARIEWSDTTWIPCGSYCGVGVVFGNFNIY